MHMDHRLLAPQMTGGRIDPPDPFPGESIAYGVAAS